MKNKYELALGIVKAIRPFSGIQHTNEIERAILTMLVDLLYREVYALLPVDKVKESEEKIEPRKPIPAYTNEGKCPKCGKGNLLLEFWEVTTDKQGDVSCRAICQECLWEGEHQFKGYKVLTNNTQKYSNHKDPSLESALYCSRCYSNDLKLSSDISKDNPHTCNICGKKMGPGEHLPGKYRPIGSFMKHQDIK